MKLKQYLNKKPKLKKLFKTLSIIITLFFALIGVVSSGFIIASCSNSKVKQVVASTPIYNKEPRYVTDYNGLNYMYALGDFLGNTPINYFIERYYYIHGDNLLNANVNNTISLSSVCIGSINVDNVDETNNFVNYVMSPNIMRVQSGHNDTTHTAYIWVDFYNSADLLNYYRLDYSFFLTNDYPDGHGDNMGWGGTLLQSGAYHIVNNNSSSWPFGYGITEAWMDSKVIANYFGLGSVDSQYWSGYQQGLMDGRSEGNTEGYNNGYSQGVTDGYTWGYNEGYSSAEGLSSNPFTLISNAFSSIASILNIDVLPNLSLGVLLFTPLIVTIIIVVVKSIKG